jgi:two-component system, chemotaxis family, CheB/CheR fusion protein
VPTPERLFWIYVAVAMALGVITAALIAAMVIYQRQFVRLHRDYSKKLLTAQEEERAWVAREVHDDALQRVAMLQHELHDWTSGENPGVGERDTQRVDALRHELEDLGVMLRRVAHRLHPALIDQAGLLPALQQLALDAGRAAGMEVETYFADEGHAAQLSRERALILFRIAQEALRNASKHSGAKRARIAVKASAIEIEVTIQDFGKGFDTSLSSKSAGLGLISMAERARLVDGRFELWSRIGEGTTVRVTVPLKG